MNILLFSRSLPCHHIGGMELIAWDVAQGLARRGHNVKVITTSEPVNPCTLSRSEDRLTIEYLENTKPGRYSGRWWKESRLAYFRAREQFKPDVIFSVSAGAKSVFPVLDSLPAVMQVHGTALGELRSKLRSGRLISAAGAVRNLIAVPQDHAMYRQAHTLVAVGPAVRDAMKHPFVRRSWSQDKIVLISNGIDTELFRPDSRARERGRKMLSMEGRAKLLLCASRLHKQKGIHLALKAFARMDSTDARFLIIGEGNERSILERQSCELGISDRVIFAGPVSHDDLPAWLNLGDAFVFTSIRDEGLPLNILEALSMDLPLVISAHIASPLKGAEGLYRVDPNDTHALSRAMERAVSSSGSGRSFIETHYSQRKMLDQYENLLHTLAAESG